ncbi:MAG TPA: polyhydroxyalkanoic acid system family protein [Pirellulaceae bacterium]|nr:polyhydroxyalkanoic acid system family protein [Pirellulaceae bacterium]HMO91740.1 polyhydroxyalkanoic acid system family protein [Pirellulaceae bacterium]HMP69797.1 polyhydroxyalkanoic acid system family protein [Pirellulaceae bacterium]
MPKIKLNVPHELERDDVINRLKRVRDDIQANYGSQISKLHEEWRDDSIEFAITAAGITVQGMIFVMHQEVRIESSFPLMAMPFRGLIETQIRKTIVDALEDDKSNPS